MNAMEAIKFLAVLFIGVFIVNILVTIPDASQYKDYVYTTATNDTVYNVNNTVLGTHNITVGAIDTSISGETIVKDLTAVYEVRNGTAATVTINVKLNGATLGSFTAANNTNTTYKFNSVAFVANSVNTITYNSTDLGANADNIRSTTISYPSGTKDTSMGAINTDLIAKVPTVYKVLVLVLIIAVLAVVVQKINFMGGAGASGTSV